MERNYIMLGKVAKYGILMFMDKKDNKLWMCILQSIVLEIGFLPNSHYMCKCEKDGL
jgi:hypothetical protein